ncbi:MAG: hypothetical protein LRS43_00385, partial [Desulfurococcales archaeon]|nr:hypothetical protein [Desulfurococcales archaeon]
MKANAIPLSALGLSTVEAVPLFHYSPGGRALRILAFPSRWPSSECPLPFDVCDWIESPRSYQEYHVSIDVVASLASRWGV